jgi:hypothetical protein
VAVPGAGLGLSGDWRRLVGLTGRPRRRRPIGDNDLWTRITRATRGASCQSGAHRHRRQNACRAPTHARDSLTSAIWVPVTRPHLPPTCRPKVDSLRRAGVPGQSPGLRAWKTATVEEFEYQVDQQQISDYADSHPEALAGWWIEHDGPSPMDGGRTPCLPSAFVIAFTSDIEDHAEALRSLLFAPERLRVIQMKYSYRHLLDVAKQMPSILGRKGFTGCGPDTKRNVVTVRVLPEQLDAVRNLFSTTHPDDVRVAPGSPVIATQDGAPR